MKLAGKTVFITGASSGIGAATATAFATEGCRILLAARRRQRLQHLAESLHNQFGVEVMVGEVDVRDRVAVTAWVGSLRAGWKEIHILVNNAGLAKGLEPLHEGEPTDWDEMIDTNLKGLLNVTRAVLPGMVERGTGHVINLGSVAGREAYPGGNVYCATKHAVVGLSRCLAIDTLGTGVRVSQVDPGMVETEFSTVRFHGDRQRADAVYDGLEPLHPEDVAQAVVFCATRPPHANVREMILMPTAQATATHLHRR